MARATEGCEIQARYDGEIDGSTGKSRVLIYALVDGERGVLVERIVDSEQTLCPHGCHRSTAEPTGVFVGYPSHRVGTQVRSDGTASPRS